MSKALQLLIISCCLIFSCKPQNQSASNILTAKDLKPFGRYFYNSQNQLELVSSAVNFGFSFTGSQFKIYSSIPDKNGHNYLQYELDGKYQKRIKISGDEMGPITIDAGTTGNHTVWIYKATEAHTGPIRVSRISAKNIKPLKRNPAPVIEFIGNSITCGAAADPSEVPCGTGQYHDQHNAYMAYGPRVARQLNVNYVLSSVSGIGIYRNWNSDGPTMPQVYEKVDFQESNSNLWDFSKFSPEIVSIALGTNDLSRGDGKKPRLPFDTTSFINNYVSFVQRIKRKYPKAKIALLSSGMVGGNDREVLQNCLTSVKQKVDKLYPQAARVSVFFFAPMQPRGCSYHPNVEDHAILAKQLVPFFKNLL